MKDQADHTAVRMPKYTGIIECDDEKLILKPNYYGAKRSFRIWGLVFGSIIIALALLCVAWIMDFQAGYWPWLGIWFVQVAGLAFSLLFEHTIILLIARGDIVRERKLIFRPIRRKKVIAKLAEIRIIKLSIRTESGPVGPLVLDPQKKELCWIHLVVGSRCKRFWYTKYVEAAVVIARKLAEFSGAPLEDPQGIEARLASGGGLGP